MSLCRSDAGPRALGAPQPRPAADHRGWPAHRGARRGAGRRQPAASTWPPERPPARPRSYFDAGELTGHPALDLRQPIDWLRLDGEDLDPDAFAPIDLGAGPGAEMRVLDVRAGSGQPPRAASRATGSRLPRLREPSRSAGTGAGVRFDLWMSDLQPGRYLEMWVPAPLIHDQFALNLGSSLSGHDRPHTVVANTAGVDAAPERGTLGAVLPRPFHRPVADAGPGPERRGRAAA